MSCLTRPVSDESERTLHAVTVTVVSLQSAWKGISEAKVHRNTCAKGIGRDYVSLTGTFRIIISLSIRYLLLFGVRVNVAILG